MFSYEFVNLIKYQEINKLPITIRIEIETLMKQRKIQKQIGECQGSPKYRA